MAASARSRYSNGNHVDELCCTEQPRSCYTFNTRRDPGGMNADGSHFNSGTTASFTAGITVETKPDDVALLNSSASASTLFTCPLPVRSETDLLGPSAKRKMQRLIRTADRIKCQAIDRVTSRSNSPNHYLRSRSNSPTL